MNETIKKLQSEITEKANDLIESAVNLGTEMTLDRVKEEYPADGLSSTIELIRKWGHDRKIPENSGLMPQYGKLLEETGELAQAIASGNEDEFVDAVGDITVVLIMLCEIKGVKYQGCVGSAYNTIKDRKGYLDENGVFIKETKETK